MKQIYRINTFPNFALEQLRQDSGVRRHCTTRIAETIVSPAQIDLCDHGLDLAKSLHSCLLVQNIPQNRGDWLDLAGQPP